MQLGGRSEVFGACRPPSIARLLPEWGLDLRPSPACPGFTAVLGFSLSPSHFPIDGSARAALAWPRLTQPPGWERVVVRRARLLSCWFSAALIASVGATPAQARPKGRAFPIPTLGSSPEYITTGPDGDLWFTEFQGNNVARITPDGAIAEFHARANSMILKAPVAS